MFSLSVSIAQSGALCFHYAALGRPLRGSANLTDAASYQSRSRGVYGMCYKFLKSVISLKACDKIDSNVKHEFI